MDKKKTGLSYATTSRFWCEDLKRYLSAYTVSLATGQKMMVMVQTSSSREVHVAKVGATLGDSQMENDLILFLVVKEHMGHLK